MAKKMLIDATQDEETRVAVLDNNGRLEEFDLEITSRQQIKGNIYLAKVTRVEPSLQAAFVNFGGNRHGFLPFSEIHPDYFRIPVADREALQAEIEALLAKRQESEEDDANEEDEDVAEALAELEAEGEDMSAELVADLVQSVEGIAEETTAVDAEEEKPAEKPKRSRRKPAKADKVEEVQDTATVETLAETEGALEDVSQDESQEIDTLDAEHGEEGDEGEEPSAEGEGETTEEGDKGRRRGRRGYRFRRGGRNGGGRGRDNRRGNNNGGGRGRRPREDDDEQEDIQSYIFRRLHRSYKIQEVIKRGQIMLVQATKEERGNKGAAMTTYMSLPGRYCVLMPNSPRSGGVSRKINDRKERDRLKEIFAGLEVPDGMSAILRTAGVGQEGDDIQRDYDYLQKTWGQIRERTLASTAPALIYQEGSVIKRAIRDIFREEVAEVVIAGDAALEEAKDFMGMLIPHQVKKIKAHKATNSLFVHYKAEEQIAAIDNHTITLKSGGYLVFSPTEALVSIDINSGRATRERHIEETALNTNLEAAEEIARQLRLRDIGGLIVIDFIDMEDHRHNVLVERKLESALSKDRARIQVGRISQFGLLELSRQRLRPSLTESHFVTCPTCQGQGMIRTTESAAVVVLRAIAQEGAKGVGGTVTVSVPTAVCVYLLNNKRDNINALEERYQFDIEVVVDDSHGESHYGITRQKGAPSSKYADREDVSEDNDDVIEDESDADDMEASANEGNGESRGNRRRGQRGGRNRRNRGRDRDRNDDNGERESVGPEKELQPTDHAPEDHAPAVVEEAPALEAKPARKGRGGRTKSDEAAANDDTAVAAKTITPAQPAAEKPAAPLPTVDKSDYEVVNEAPEKPKKGWWRKAIS